MTNNSVGVGLVTGEPGGRRTKTWLITGGPEPDSPTSRPSRWQPEPARATPAGSEPPSAQIISSARETTASTSRWSRAERLIHG